MPNLSALKALNSLYNFRLEPAIKLNQNNSRSKCLTPKTGMGRGTVLGLFTFTFMHLADAFIQSDLQLHSGYTFSLVCVPWESNPQPFALLTQCSTTEPHRNTVFGR